jgi:RecB family endonuclease NucS
MLTEKAMEDAIAENPEKYLESGLVLKERQHRVGNYIFDLLFQDRHGAKLIVELQKGTLDRNHTYKILVTFKRFGMVSIQPI